MRDGFMKKSLVFIIIVVFVGSSLPYLTAAIEERSGNGDTIYEDVEEYTKLFDEKPQVKFCQMLNNEGDFYVTESDSNLGIGYSRTWPILFSFFDPIVFFYANVDYYGLTPETKITRLNGEIVDYVSGAHSLSITGFGTLQKEKKIGGYKIHLAAISITKPKITKK